MADGQIQRLFIFNTSFTTPQRRGTNKDLTRIKDQLTRIDAAFPRWIAISTLWRKNAADRISPDIRSADLLLYYYYIIIMSRMRRMWDFIFINLNFHFRYYFYILDISTKIFSFFCKNISEKWYPQYHFHKMASLRSTYHR